MTPSAGWGPAEPLAGVGRRAAVPGGPGAGGGGWGSALARSLARSLTERAGDAMSGEDGPGAGPGAGAAAARERRQEQLRQWGARAGAEPGPGERRVRTVRFERAAEFLAACACGDLDEARLMLRAADPGPDAELDPSAPSPARAVLDSTNADGISALHQVSAPAPPRASAASLCATALPPPGLHRQCRTLLSWVDSLSEPPLPSHAPRAPLSIPEPLELALAFTVVRLPLRDPNHD